MFFHGNGILFKINHDLLFVHGVVVNLGCDGPWILPLAYLCEFLQHKRQAVAHEEIGGVADLEMQVGGIGIPRVAQKRQEISFFYLVAGLHFKGVFNTVCIQAVGSPFCRIAKSRGMHRLTGSKKAGNSVSFQIQFRQSYEFGLKIEEIPKGLFYLVFDQHDSDYLCAAKPERYA